MLLWTQDAYEAPQPRLGSLNPGFWLAQAGQLPESQAFILPSARPPLVPPGLVPGLLLWIQNLSWFPWIRASLVAQLGKNSPQCGRHEFDTCIGKSESESEVAQSCPTLCNPMDCSLPGSSICGILQARTLQWVVISFSMRWEDPLEKGKATHSSILAGEFQGLYRPWGCEELDTTERLSLSLSLGSRLSAVSSTETCSGRTNPRTGPEVFTLQADSGGSKFQAYATATPAIKIIQYCNMLV